MNKSIVIKIGTSSLTQGSLSLNRPFMQQLVAQIAHLHNQGEKIVLVSSGSIAAGRQYLKSFKQTKSLPFRQMLSSIGQVRLMDLWTDLFAEHNILVGQVLLTRADFSNRGSYLNIRNTLDALLIHGVIPVINENDTVATQEIKVGDNDNLSAYVANLLGAKLLLLLTDQEGLYTAHPQQDKTAKLIPLVEIIDQSVVNFAQGSDKGGLGTGGMATKIEAAKLASRSGTPTVIAKADRKDVLKQIVSGQPVGTRFTTPISFKESRKRWLLSEKAQGTLIVDSGAAEKLRKGGASLLAVGISETKRVFERGAIVEIVSKEGQVLAVGITNYASDEIEKIQSVRSDKIEEILGYSYGPEVIHRDNLTLVHT